jgi:hypothetical protein
MADPFNGKITTPSLPPPPPPSPSPFPIDMMWQQHQPPSSPMFQHMSTLPLQQYAHQPILMPTSSTPQAIYSPMFAFNQLAVTSAAPLMHGYAYHQVQSQPNKHQVYNDDSKNKTPPPSSSSPTTPPTSTSSTTTATSSMIATCNDTSTSSLLTLQPRSTTTNLNSKPNRTASATSTTTSSSDESDQDNQDDQPNTANGSWNSKCNVPLDRASIEKKQIFIAQCLEVARESWLKTYEVAFILANYHVCGIPLNTDVPLNPPSIYQQSNNQTSKNRDSLVVVLLQVAACFCSIANIQSSVVMVSIGRY